MPDHYGNLLLPAQGAGDKEAPGDPLLDVLLSFFEAVINADAGLAYRSVGIGRETSQPVMHRFAHNPEQQFFDWAKAPALYLYREFNAPSEWIAQDYYVRDAQLVLLWVPPRVESQERRARLRPFVNAIQSVLDNTLEPGARHPAWKIASDTDPRTLLEGSLLWRYADLWKLDMGRSEWTEIIIPMDKAGVPDAPPVRVPAVKTVVLLGERNQGTVPEDLDPYTVDGTIQTAATAPEGALDYLEFDFELTIASVSPSTGSENGGTTLVIHGTGFVPGAVVKVGDVECTDVEVSTPGVLTAVTPSGSSLDGAQDVTVMNPDADVATAAAAFTYVVPPSIDLGTWNLFGTTRTGSYPVYTFKETATNNFHEAFSSALPVLGATAIRVTVRVQMIGRQWFWVNITPTGSPDEYVYFDLTNGVHGFISSGVSQVGLTNLGGGVWEVQATFSALANPYFGAVSFGLNTADNQGTYLGDVTKGCIVSYLIAEAV